MSSSVETSATTSTLKVQHDISLADLHSFALPARAARFVCVESHADILSLTDLPDWSWLTVRVLGGGSNSIFIDDYSGWVLKCNLRERRIEIHPTASDSWQVTAGAGEPWDDFVAWSLAQGCYGLENLSWIPGTVGAAPLQNIGAYGVELAEVLDAVEVYDYQHPDKGFFWLERAECGFGYRDSWFKTKWSYLLITRVRLRLYKEFKPVLDYPGLNTLPADTSAQAVRQQVIQLRQAKLPDPGKIPNAGSFFKNPVISDAAYQKLLETYETVPAYKLLTPQPDGETVLNHKVPAAWLLEQAGFKGQWFGEFGCYELQPLVLIHDRRQQHSIVEKKARLLEWIDTIQQSIKQHFNIWLEIEPVLVSDLT